MLMVMLLLLLFLLRCLLLVLQVLLEEIRDLQRWKSTEITGGGRGREEMKGSGVVPRRNRSCEIRRWHSGFQLPDPHDHPRARSSQSTKQGRVRNLHRPNSTQIRKATHLHHAFLRSRADAEVVEIGGIDATVREESADDLGMSSIDSTTNRIVQLARRIDTRIEKEKLYDLLMTIPTRHDDGNVTISRGIAATVLEEMRHNVNKTVLTRHLKSLTVLDLQI